jgi:hypothetical protein
VHVNHLSLPRAPLGTLPTGGETAYRGIVPRFLTPQFLIGIFLRHLKRVFSSSVFQSPNCPTAAKAGPEEGVTLNTGLVGRRPSRPSAKCLLSSERQTPLIPRSPLDAASYSHHGPRRPIL